MKSNSIVNLLTAVMFSLVTVFSHVGWGQEKKKDEGESSDSQMDAGRKACKDLSYPTPKYKDQNECILAILAGSNANNKCEDALKEFQKKNLEYAKACKAIKNPALRLDSQANSTDLLFGGSSSKEVQTINIDVTKQCRERIDQCREQLNAVATGSKKDDPNSVDNILKTVMAVKDPQGLQQYEKAAGTSQQSNQSMSIQDCADTFNNKDVNQKKKDYKAEKKKLEEDMQKIKDDFDKEMEKQNEKNAEITKKIEELQTKSKEKNRDSDAKLREKNTENQKNSINYAKQARDINNKIIAKQVQLKKMQFDNANKLLSETTDKINMQCQAVLNKAQECLVKSIKVKAAVSEDCKSFPVLSTKRGSAATAELKNKMKFINDQCYQEADTSKKNSAYSYQEALAQANRDIQNLQQDLQDLQNNINIESNNASQISQEAKREQDENAQAVAQQTQNFNNELQNILLTSKQKQETLTTRMQQKEKEILQLDYEQKTGTESKLSAAEEVITEYDAAKDVASDACGCTAGSKTDACVQIDKYHTKASAGLPKPSSQSGRTKR